MSIAIFDVECISLGDLVLPRDGYLGYNLRGLIYSLLAEADSECFEEVHSGGVPAPFSLYPPVGAIGGSIRILRREIKRGMLFRFQVRSLSPRFTKALAGVLSERNRFEVGGVDVEVLSRKCEILSPEELVRFGERASDTRRILISFRTPTSIRYRVPVEPKRMVLHPLPDPRPILGGLHSIWNTYLKPKITNRFIKWVERMGVCVAGFRRMRTVRLFEYEGGVRKRFDIGFIGLVRYTLPEELYDRKMARYVYALLKMAEYSNVGRGRTAGLGAVKLLSPRVR